MTADSCMSLPSSIEHNSKQLHEEYIYIDVHIPTVNDNLKLPAVFQFI